MTQEIALTMGSALLAFGPFLALFSMLVYQKAQLVIVVTTAAFFFLLAAMCASASWYVFHQIGFNGPFAAIIPGVFFQFIFRCAFVTLYHRVEYVIQVSLQKHHEEELRRQQQNPFLSSMGTAAGIGAGGTGTVNNDVGTATGAAGDGSDMAQHLPTSAMDEMAETAKLRLALNDASCGVAAGLGYGGMHAILLYGTLLASQASNNVGVLYQDSCPMMPAVVVSALFCLSFTILDIFWMLFTFFGVRRRLIYHRGGKDETQTRVVMGGLLGNSRLGGNLALLWSLITHAVASAFTTANYYKYGCQFSLPAVGCTVLLTAYIFWAGVGRIYMPPAQSLTIRTSMSRTDEDHDIIIIPDAHHVD